jgi:Spy/CpxP family protein refolding chaperone
MKKSIQILLFTIPLLIAGLALAADHGKERRGHRGGPDMALPGVSHLTRAMRHLDLAAEQKEAIHADFKAMREQLRPIMKQAHESRRALHGLITAQPYDADAVAELAAKHGNLTADITRIAAATAAGVLAKLNDQQRAKLEAMGERRREKMAERLERRKQPKQQPQEEEGAGENG